MQKKNSRKIKYHDLTFIIISYSLLSSFWKKKKIKINASIHNNRSSHIFFQNVETIKQTIRKCKDLARILDTKKGYRIVCGLVGGKEWQE